MPEHDPKREFATEIVQRLKQAGFQALWAGGCVRDTLLGREPQDYDVATDARPEQVRDLLGKRRTLEVGAAFGVIIVLGTKESGQIEVATFRTEGPYADGRRPDHVSFSSPEEDARRRDFTINGMFYDPIGQQVFDYVGGQQDLAARVVRAIGDPRARMTEDKLRLLRATRFVATLNFTLDPATQAAVTEMAPQIHVVSAERIAQELRRMLMHRERRRAIELTRDTGLLHQILPEIATPLESLNDEATRRLWDKRLLMLQQLESPSFALAFAALLYDVGPEFDRLASASKICRRFKFSNQDTDDICWILEHYSKLDGASDWSMARRKRLAAHALFSDALALFRVELLSRSADMAPALFWDEFLREHSLAEINPPPLIDGADLIRLGLQPGPLFRDLLDAARDAQLNGEVTTRDEAVAYVKQTLNTNHKSEGHEDSR